MKPVPLPVHLTASIEIDSTKLVHFWGWEMQSVRYRLSNNQMDQNGFVERHKVFQYKGFIDDTQGQSNY